MSDLSKSTKSYLVSQIDSFLIFLEKNLGRGELTIKTYEPVLREAFEMVAIDSSRQILDFFLYRENISSQKPKTVAKKLSAIRSFLDFVEKDGFLYRTKGLNSIKTPKTLPKPISHEHIIEVIEDTKAETELLIQLIYSLGLRISEASNIRLKDINGRWINIVGKGSKERQIPIIDSLSEMLKSYIETHEPKEFLFEQDSKRLSENQLRYRLSKAFEKLGIKATPHQLRHAFATELINGGARITDVSELLGHSQLATTEIYTKLSGKAKLQNYTKAHPLCKADQR